MSLFRVIRGPDGRIRFTGSTTRESFVSNTYVSAQGAAGNLEYKTLYYSFYETDNLAVQWQRVTGLIRPGKFRKHRK